MTQRDDRRAGFGADGRGAIAVMTALLLPVLIGIAAYAIDASLLLYRQERLQIAADIGARAGKEMLERGESEARAIAMAEAMVAANAGAPAGVAPVVEVTLPEPGRLSVEASLPVPRFFSQIFGSDDVIVAAGSVAVYEMAAEPDACLYLDGSKNKALEFEEESRLTLTNCAIDIRNSKPISVEMKKRSSLVTDCLTVAGRVNGDSRIASNCPGIREEDDEVADPLPIPLAPRLKVDCEDWESDDEDKEKNGKGKGRGDDEDDEDGASDPDGAGLSPGAPFQFGLPQICLSEMTVESDTDGGPGIYFIEDKLKIKDGATLTLGAGSLIVLLDKAKIDMDDDATLVITAPDSGDLAGMAIMQGHGRYRPEQRDHDLGRIEIEGRVALPGEEIEIKGQSSAARCTRIHAGTLEFDNDAELKITC